MVDEHQVHCPRGTPSLVSMGLELPDHGLIYFAFIGRPVAVQDAPGNLRVPFKETGLYISIQDVGDTFPSLWNRSPCMRDGGVLR